MPFTTLDPRTALIVIDVQKGILALPVAHPTADVVQRAASLAAAFRARSLPVVLVTVAGGAPGRTDAPRRAGDMPADWLELAPELDRQPSDHLVTKKTWGAFSGTDLDAHLKAQGVTQVAICGVATSIGVESTARQAHELGYHVSLAVDAMTDMQADAHANSIARIFPRLAETGTTQQLLDLLATR